VEELDNATFFENTGVVSFEIPYFGSVMKRGVNNPVWVLLILIAGWAAGFWFAVIFVH
jgi:hypothetical protein